MSVRNWVVYALFCGVGFVVGYVVVVFLLANGISQETVYRMAVILVVGSVWVGRKRFIEE